MHIKEYVTILEEKNIVQSIVIKKTFKELVLNLIKVFINLIKSFFLKEERNDIKVYVRSIVLETPPDFKASSITEENKKKIKAFIIANRKSIKIKEQGINVEFKKKVNETIEIVTTSESLDSLLNSSNNIKELYSNIINKITNIMENNFRTLEPMETKSLKVNVQKKVGEVLGIKLVAPNTSTTAETPGGTYYQHEPNGPGTFPDFMFYFGKVENEDAKNIRKIFSIPSNIPRVSFEVKTGTNIVGKQRSPQTFLDNLKNKNVFKKMTNLKINNSVEIDIYELIDILNADGLGVDKYTAYLNPAGKTSKTQVKKLKWLADFAPFKINRTTPGQMAITGDGKVMFKIEIGRTAYEQGMFKVVSEEVLNDLLLEVRNV